MVLTILLGFVDGMRRTVMLAAERGHYLILQRGPSGGAVATCENLGGSGSGEALVTESSGPVLP
jgi:hypothetical protein